jgi:hypothetical protein
MVDDVKTDNSRKFMTVVPELLAVLALRRQCTEFAADEDWVFASPSKLAGCPTARQDSGANSNEPPRIRV